MECQVSLSTNQPPSSKPPGCQHDLFRPVRLPGDRPSPSWLAERFLEERAPRLAVADPPEDDDAAAAGRSKLAIAVPTSTRIRRSPYLGSAVCGLPCGLNGGHLEQRNAARPPAPAFSHTFLAGLAPFIHHHPCTMTILLILAALASLTPSVLGWRRSLPVAYWFNPIVLAAI
ncbi:hypothetical protein LY78DRAFT_59544 [Colletotrichum sublineola]|nr:hypothetical protein LY78DRAFT_59544 [Colletotrichum sublineola]